MNWIFNLQKSISKLIFAGYTGSKNQVWNRLKIQFVELDFSKIKYRWIGCKIAYWCTLLNPHCSEYITSSEGDPKYPSIKTVLFAKSNHDLYRVVSRYLMFYSLCYFASLQFKYRVFQPDLIYFEDLGGQLKTIFWSKWRYLCIPEVWAFEFHQPVFEKVT